MRKLKLLLVCMSVSTLALTMAPASADEVILDCGRGDTFGEALDVKHVKQLEPIEIWFTGTCTENVTIARDDVYIAGEGDAELIGGIFIEDSKRILLRGFRITGSGTGIFVSGGSSSALIDQVNLFENDGIGLEVVGGGSVVLTDSTIEGNHSGAIVSWSVLQVDNNSFVKNNLDAGILGLDGSRITIANSEVSGHPGTGIFLRNGSTALLNNAKVSGNAEGMVLTAGSILIDSGTKINGNDDNGIRAELHSTVQIENASIYDNQGEGVKLRLDSGLFNSYGQAEIYSNGGSNVLCEDSESSAVFLGSTPSDVICTGYDQIVPSP